MAANKQATTVQKNKTINQKSMGCYKKNDCYMSCADCYFFNASLKNNDNQALIMILKKYPNNDGAKHALQTLTSGELITAATVQTIGERIAVKALKTILQRSGQPYINELYGQLIAGINDIKAGRLTVINDGYDIAQTAIAFLCGYIGQRLTDSAADGQTDKDGAPVNIMRACFRAVNRYIMGQRAKQYKTIVLDDNNGKYITPPPLWDMPTITDLTTVKKAIESMKLSATEKRILSRRLQSKSYDTIAEEMGITKGSVQTYIKRIAAKAAKIGIAPKR